MGHANAPLTPAGRRRLCERVDQGRPIAHVADEAGISRRCLAKWYERWRAEGLPGLLDRTTVPEHSPTRTDAHTEDLVELLRRSKKYGPARIAAELERDHKIVIAPATVHRILVRRGINHLRDLDPPTGEQMRAVLRFEHDAPGSMITSTSRSSVASRPAAAGGLTAEEPTYTVPPSARAKAPDASATPTCTPPSTTTPGWPTPRRWRTRKVSPRRTSGSGPQRSSPNTASPLSSGA